ncbi:hypothetical protein, partial [Novacetimonas hansenii]|uniref:hypothetical protein n=1 Tax=Novacetimonas hansenii TaxID=436 RepID=UPI001E32BD5E
SSYPESWLPIDSEINTKCNCSAIKNRKIFLELPFDRKKGGISKIFEKDSPKTFIISRFYRTYLFKQSPSVSVGVKRL